MSNWIAVFNTLFCYKWLWQFSDHGPQFGSTHKSAPARDDI